MIAMEAGLKIFEKPEFGSVRVVEKDGDPWFVAKDVCEALELDNVGQALSSLDDDEKNTIIINDGIPGNPNRAIFVSEFGISRAMKSRSGASKRLKNTMLEGGAPIPVFLASKNLLPYITNDLRNGPLMPIQNVPRHKK